MLIDNPWFYIIAAPAIICTGISKGGLGAGAGLISTPLLALIVSPAQAAAVMLPILCAMDLFGVGAYRNSFDRPNIRIMIPGAVVGIGIGALSFEYMNEHALRLMLGAIAIGFTVRHWLGSRGGTERAPAPRHAVKGAFWAGVSGFTSTIAHAGGPPAAVYLLPQRMDKTVFVGTTVMFFFAVNYLKLVPYWMIGQFTGINLATSLVLLPLAPVGMMLGFWLHSRINSTWFYRIVYGLVFLTGCRLIWLGSAGLLA
jgi:uncharacterized membrane protein YfcA